MDLLQQPSHVLVASGTRGQSDPDHASLDRPSEKLRLGGRERVDPTIMSNYSAAPLDPS